MLKCDRPSYWQASLALSTISLVTNPVCAQITPDNSLGSESSLVNPDVKVKDAVADLISGGAVRGNNLFHSFEQFNISDVARVYFANPDGVANILTRVTGNNLSQIFGTLGVDGAANLFLLNPNGIIFGGNAALDVNGSFLATTADNYIFKNGFEYSASNPQSPPLLTINMPVGLQFGTRAAAIEVRGKGHNLELDNFLLPVGGDRPTGLKVNSGNTLALVGGEINLKGGNLTAPESRIELGSIANNSEVSLISAEDDFSLGYQNINNFNNINLTQAASIDLSGNGSGSLQLQGNNISLLDGSVVIADNLGAKNGGDLNLNAADSIKVMGKFEGFFPSVITTLVEVDAIGEGGTVNMNAQNLMVERGGVLTPTRGLGKGGNLVINANNLMLKDMGILTTATLSTGDSGNLSIKANNLQISGESPRGISGIFTDTYHRGKGGNLTINANNFSIKDGGTISSGTFSGGDGGDLSVEANNIEISGKALGRPSGIFTPADFSTTGNGGNLAINAKQLVLKDKALISSYTAGEGKAGNIDINVQQLDIGSGLAQISTLTYGKGNAGDLRVRATESIEISGTGLVPNFSPNIPFESLLISSGLLSTVEPGAAGNGGNLTVETPHLKIFDGGQILTSTFGSGQGGNLLIRANNLEIRNTVVNHFGIRSGISSSVEKPGSNHGGNIEIMADNLSLLDGGLIAANSLGQENAGNIKITAENTKVAGSSSGEPIFGVEQPKLPATIAAFSQGNFNAGFISINTDNLNVSDRGLISVSNLGNGKSGNLNITASQLNLDNSATLEAKVGAGSQGNINLTTDNIFLRNNSEINAQASGTATGGNITVNNTDNIVLLQNSKIIADAIKGNGGNINITTVGLFVSPDSKITAKSQFALDGTVDIDELNSDRHLESNRLPEKTVDPNSRITSSCSTSNQNTFAVTGNGGVPNSPYATQSLNATWYDLRPVKQEPTKLVSLATPLTEANTTIINSQGKLELIALTPLSNYRWVKSSCSH